MAANQTNIISLPNSEYEKENYFSIPGTVPVKSKSVSKYPHHFEKKVITRTGIELFMRPIKPEDEPLLIDMFNNLSFQTRYYRFFSPLKALPKEMLKKFTLIDYSRDMALVAMDNDQARRILAVARFISRPDQPDAEFAVVVRDEWQGKGVGRVLLGNLILFAREKQIECMSGYVMAENFHMLSLARKLGFDLSRVPGEEQYFLKIDLKSEGASKIA